MVNYATRHLDSSTISMMLLLAVTHIALQLLLAVHNPDLFNDFSRKSRKTCALIHLYARNDCPTCRSNPAPPLDCGLGLIVPVLLGIHKYVKLS